MLRSRLPLLQERAGGEAGRKLTKYNIWLPEKGEAGRKEG